MPSDLQHPTPAQAADTPVNPLPQIDRAALLALLEDQARHALGRLLSSGTPQAEAVVAAQGGWTLLVSLFPTPPLGPEADHDLTPCDRDCLRILSVADRPLPADRVRNELESRKLAIWGLVTVKRSLAKLKKLGVVFNSHKLPRGYYLAEKHTLFRPHAADAG
jgi:hypothetical protein